MVQSGTVQTSNIFLFGASYPAVIPPFSRVQVKFGKATRFPHVRKGDVFNHLKTSGYPVRHLSDQQVKPIYTSFEPRLMTTSDYAKLHPNCQQTLQYDFETRSTSPVFILATTRFNVQPNEDDPLEEAPCFDVGEDQRTPPGQLFKCLFFGREIRSRVT